MAQSGGAGVGKDDVGSGAEGAMGADGQARDYRVRVGRSGGGV